MGQGSRSEDKDRRGHKEGGITKRYNRDGVLLGYQVQVLLPNGQRKTLGTTKKKADAVKLAQTGQVALAEGRLAGTPRLAMADYLEQWLESKRPTVRYKTHVTYRTVLGHAIERIGKIQLGKVRPTDIEQCERDVANSKGVRTAQQMHMVLHQAFRRAVQLEVIARNPTDAVTPPRYAPSERPSLTLEQTRTLFAHTEKDQLHGLYVLLATTGLRLGEALGLIWADVDFDARLMTVRRSLQRRTGEGVVVEELKTAKSRRLVPLMALTLEALHQHKARQSEQRLLLGPDWPDLNLVFTSTNGGPLDAGNCRRSCYAALQRAGLPHVRLHDLRHTATSLMAAEGVPIHVIQAVLGHANSSTTMNIYTHVAPTSYEDARKRMDAAFAAAAESS